MEILFYIFSIPIVVVLFLLIALITCLIVMFIKVYIEDKLNKVCTKKHTITNSEILNLYNNYKNIIGKELPEGEDDIEIMSAMLKDLMERGRRL